MPNNFGGSQHDEDYKPTTKRVFDFDFREMTASLNNWAEFLNDSPVALAIFDRFKVDVLARYPSLKWPRDILNDFTRFMAAVYHGGYNAGQVRGAQDYAATQPEPPQAIRVHGAWETEDERNTHGDQIGWFSTDVDAKIAAQGRGWYGGEGAVISYDAIRYDGVVYVLRDRIDAENMGKDLPKLKEAKRQAALAKLTPEERNLLNLKDE